MKIQLRRKTYCGDRFPMVAFMSKWFELQLLPNFYVRIGGYDVAIDMDGILAMGPSHPNRPGSGFIYHRRWRGDR